MTDRVPHAADMATTKMNRGSRTPLVCPLLVPTHESASKWREEGPDGML